MRRTATRVLLALAVLGLLLGVMRGGASSSPANDFTVKLAVASKTVTAGRPIQFDLTIFRGSLFTAGVNYSVSGLPPHAHGSWQRPAYSNAIFTINTAQSTPLGAYQLTFTAQGGHRTHKATGQLRVVERPPTPGFTLYVSPRNVHVRAGTSASVLVTISRRQVSAPIKFSVAGLPRLATAAAVPATTFGNRLRVTISTSLGTPRGYRPIVVIGKSPTIRTTVTFHLFVSAGHVAHFRTFAISGSAQHLLTPGVSAPINLAITNPNNQTLHVSHLTVTITGTSTPGCTTSNFSITQFGGSYPVNVPANSTRHLSQLGIAQAKWPRIAMLNLPVNQDICKNTTINLSFSGAGNGA